MHRRTLLRSAPLVALATLAAPHVARAADARVLRFVPQADLAVLDPVWTTATVSRIHGFLVHDTLYGQTGPKRGFKVTPQMVAGHVIEDDGKTWRLTLREGLLFHDGTKVLARDCVASIRRWAVRDGFGQTLLERTDEVSAADDKTIVFRLKRPFPLLADALGKSSSNMCPILPERLAQTDPFKQVTEMVGSGPYRFKADERVAGSFVAYERFAGYQPCPDGEPDWSAGPKVAHFDRVEWHIIPDSETAAAALQSGEVDYWEFATVDLLPLLKRDPALRVELIYETGIGGIIRPNHLHPPFDNPAVRRALWSGIDQTDFMTAMMGTDQSLWHVPAGFFPPGMPMASDAGMAALAGPRDAEAARTALRAAGYRGERIVLMAPVDFPWLKALADVAADTLKRVGFDVDYQAIDWGTLVQRRASKNPPDRGGWNVFCTGWPGIEIATPASNPPLRANGEHAWFGWPSSPRLEALREQWLDATDLAAQKAIAADIQAQAFADVPYYPVGMTFPPSAYRSNLTGMLKGMPFFWNVART